jgi:alpha-tubulin suppressor-like RCC1 family protein
MFVLSLVVRAAADGLAQSNPLAKVVDAGRYHTCALTTAGGVECWGVNIENQLGDGTQNDRSVLVACTASRAASRSSPWATGTVAP